MAWKVFVAQQTCEGYACCVMAVPSVFDLDDDTGKAKTLLTERADSLRSAVEDAEHGCPVHAVGLETT